MSLVKGPDDALTREERLEDMAGGIRPRCCACAKLSVSLALVLLTAGAALALTHSRIAEHLFGGNENIPRDVEEMLLTPQVTKKTRRVCFPLMNFSMTAACCIPPLPLPILPGRRFCTLEGIWINGNQVLYDGMITEGAWDKGFLLGGSADDKALPESYSLYSRAEQVYCFSEDGKYQGLPKAGCSGQAFRGCQGSSGCRASPFNLADSFGIWRAVQGRGGMLWADIRFH